ncbi:MAG: ABC transporter ATP-binding protein [Dehalococcoidia bacterium]|nr:ABC transporter ATP-binding protein [Dehalococcoidia bacterium]
MTTRVLQRLRGPRTKVPIRQYGTLLLKYLRQQKGLVALSSLFILTNIGLQLVNPQIMRYFIDEAVAGSPLGRLVTAAGVFIAVALVQQFVGVLATYTSGQVGWNATNALRSDLARHALSLDMPFHNSRTPGEMIERIDGDSETLGGFFSTFAVHILGNIIMLVTVLALLFRENWLAGLALSTFAFVSIVVIIRMRNVSVASWRANREASTETYGFIEERLAGREDIRTSGAQSHIMKGHFDHMWSWFHVHVRAYAIASVVANTAQFINSAGLALSLLVGAYLFYEDWITIGTVFLIYQYSRLLNRPVNSVSYEMEELQQAGASVIRIHDLLSARPEVIDGRGVRFPDGPLPVRFDSVSFAYGSGESVLRDVTLNFRAGRVLGLLGRTGSGKTTMTRLLFRLYDPDEGRVLIGGEDIREARISDLRARVGLVPQDVRLFHGTVRDNLTFFDRSVPDVHLLNVLGEMNLTRWYDTLPDNLDTMLQPDGGGLSSGEAQLLAFARVFLKDPGLVILDEATSRLDPSTEASIKTAIDRLVRGRTVLIVAHHLATIQRCDDIVILENGRLVESGERKLLASDPMTRFHRLLRTGFEEVLS